MTIAEYQYNMRQAYAGGATGIFASSLIWFAAAFIAYFGTPAQSIIGIYIGGMLIFPLSIVFSKLVGRRGSHDAKNVLGKLAIETTIFMLVCFPLAYAASLAHIEWFYPAMLCIIGGRYFIFSTIYGLKTYWLLGGALLVGALCLLLFKSEFYVGALMGALIELLFAFVVYKKSAQ
jgi:hypothetical protein